MPTLNVRLAAIIFFVVVVVGGGVHLLHGFQVGRQASALKVASAHAETEKNLSEAIRLLQNYVILVPSDHAAELHLGILFADSHNVMAAYRFLEEAIRLADESIPPDELRKARRKLVDVYLVLGRYGDAQTHLEVLLEGAVEKNKERRAKGEPPQGDPELLELYGQILPYSARDKEARDVLQDAITIAPQQVNAYIRLAMVLSSRLNQQPEADAVVESMLKNNSKSVTAYEKYAYYYMEQQKFDVALDAARKAHELVPDDYRALFLLGRCYLLQKEYDKAIEFLKLGIKAEKTDRAMYMVLAEALNQVHKPKEAIEILKQGMQATKGTKAGLEILWDLANAQIVAGEYDEAHKDIADLREGGYPQPMADFLDARIAIQQQDWLKAFSLLKDSVIPGTQDAPGIGRSQDAPGVRRLAWIYMAQCYHEAGNEKEQVLALERALKIDPSMFTARNALADIYLSHHKLEQAAEQYTFALNSPQREEAKVNLVRILIMQQLQLEKYKRKWQPVDELLDQLMAKKAIRPDIVVLKAEVLLSKASEASDDGSSEEAAQELRRLADVDIKQAADLLKQCTDKVPKNAEGWLARIRLVMHLAGRETDPAKKAELWNSATGLVDAAEKNLGDCVPVRMARGSLAVRSKDPHVVDVLKKLGENLPAFSNVEKLQLWGVLATLAHEANDLDLARAYCRLVAEKEPKNVRIRYLLCELDLRSYEKSGSVDMPELDRLVDEIERLGGQGPYWLYAKAIRSLVQSKNKDPQLLLEARGCLRDAMESRPDWAALAVLSGKICELQDEPDQALDFYVRAIYSMNDRDNEVIRRAVQLLVPRGRIDEAKQLFDYLEKQKSSLIGEMQQEYIYVKVFKGDIKEAEGEVDKYVAADSTNDKDLAWQGQMYGYLVGRLKFLAVQRQVDKASEEWKSDPAMLKMAQKSVNSLLRAHKLNPQADDASVALVRLLIEVGRPEKAQPLIADMENTLKGDKALTTIAYCCELLHDTAKAQEKYEAAVKAAPQNCRVLRLAAGFYLHSGKVPSAEPLLRTIISLEQPSTLTDVCWARRNLALVYKNRGDFDGLTKAVELIDQNLNSRAATSEDKRHKVQFLIEDPRKEKINEAIAGMEDLVKAPDAKVDDYFALAKLYLKNGNQAAFEDQMRNVLGASRVQPRHLVFYIGLLLERKNFSDAEQWLRSLEKMAPDSFDTLRLRADYEFSRGDYKAAGDMSMNYLDKQVGERAQQIYNVAMLMEGFAGRLKADNKQIVAADFLAKAEELFRALRSKKLVADGDLIYADFLARQKRIKEALDVLEQASDTKRFDLLRMAAASILGSRAATSEQCDQLEKILSAVSVKANRPTELLVVLAIVHDQQKHFDKAQDDYRAIIAKDPRNYPALNNLALNLARNGGNLDEALNFVNQALTISGPLSDVLDSRAIVYIARQEFDKALQDVNAAVQNEGSAEEYFHQAWILSLLDRKPEAAAAFSKAQEKGLDPTRIDSHEVSVYERLRDSQ